jgi:hypothetical protein
MLSNVDGEGTTPGSIIIELLSRIALNRTRSLMLEGLCPPNSLGFNVLLPKQRIELQTRQEGIIPCPLPPLLRRSGRVPALPYPPLRPIRKGRYENAEEFQPRFYGKGCLGND